MNIKTFLMYAAIAGACSGAGVVILPHLISSGNAPQEMQESGESGNIQRKGPPPIMTPGKGY